MRRELGDQQGVSLVLSNLGLVAQLLAHHATAHALYEEALAIQRTLGDRATIAILTHNVGTVLCELSDYSSAQAMLKEALALWDELGSRAGVVASLEAFAGLARLQAQPARAARLWGLAARLREEIGSAQSPRTQADIDVSVAAARTAMGNDDAFESAWAEGRAVALDQVMRELLES